MNHPRKLTSLFLALTALLCMAAPLSAQEEASGRAQKPISELDLEELRMSKSSPQRRSSRS